MEELLSARIHGVDPEYISGMTALLGKLSLDQLVHAGLTTDDAYTFTMRDVSRKFLDDLRSLGYERLPVEAPISKRIHGVSIDYVKKVKVRRGDVAVDELVNMRIHGRD